MEQKIIGELIKEYRIKNNLSLREFAEKTSFSHTFISNLEKNYNPSTKKAPVLTFEMLDELAKVLGYSLNELLDILKGDTVITVNNNEDTIKVPLFANISQNKGDNAIRYIDLPKERLNGQNADYFLYKVIGDNMAPKYLDGDIVLFKYNNMPKNNKDVLININDKETVFSKINIEENSIKLNKYNPFYEDITYTKEEMKKLNIKIIAEVQSLEYRDLRNN